MKNNYTKLRVNPETAWPTVQKMLYKMAWKVTDKYGVPFEETRSEVYLAFMKACWRWKQCRGARFGSFCCFIASCRLRRLIMDKAEASRTMPCIELNEEIIGYAPEQRSECMEMIDDLSEDAKEIVALLLEIPEDLLGRKMEPGSLLTHVKRHLRRRGKGRDAIDAAHRELAERLAQRSSPTLLQRFGFENAMQVKLAVMKMA